VEDTLCLTGGSDGNIRLWDLRVVEDYEDRLQRASEQEANQDPLDRISHMNSKGDYDWDQEASFSAASQVEESGPCVRTLEGHSKSVTSLYYEDGCLVCDLYNIDGGC
jgi:division protein 1